MRPEITETFRNYPPKHTTGNEEARQLQIQFPLPVRRPKGPASVPSKLGKNKVKKISRKRERLLIQGGLCAGCELELTEATATWDHVKPVIRGGGNGPENKVLMCERCNASKSNCETLEEALGQYFGALFFTDKPNKHMRNRIESFERRVMVMASMRAKGIIQA